MNVQMKNILQIASIVLLVFSSVGIKAQAKDTGEFSTKEARTDGTIKFSLEEAQKYALENSFMVKGSDYDLKVARKKVWEAISTGLPQVKADANYTKNLDIAVSLLPAEFFGGNAGEYTPVKFGQTYASAATINVDQKIFDGSYIVGLSAAKVFVQLSKNSKIKSEIDVKDLVAQAYYNVLVARENYRTIEENLAITKKTHFETEAYYKNGFREELDVDQVLLMLKRSENQLSDAKRTISNALIILKFTMGYDIEKDIELKNDLEAFINPLLITKAESKELNLENHIDYKIVDTQLKAQKLIVRNEQAGYLPNLSAFYSYGKNTSTDAWNIYKSDVPWFKSSMIGLKINMPIFTGFNRRSKIKQAKINYKKIEDLKYNTEQSLKKDLNLSYNSLVNAKDTYENDLKGLEIAKRIYERTLIKFNEGVSTSTELSNNEQQYLNSHSTYIQATLNLLNSKVAFDKALGKL
ncbi:TolC family protein [Ancylomarina salipaludis]|uniref:TolC family protein n=2 Tax=Ancylomarina salipaludis TaxID=2501299 RepID=A0A4Q1JMB3_9BACT|nr:TolC family protein [Ancylomarina salipaludis]